VNARCGFNNVSLAVLLATATAFAILNNVRADGKHIPPGRYEIVVSMVMPNLEVNLRNLTKTKEMCITSVADMFPILKHPSLAGCELVFQSEAPNQQEYELACSSGNGIGGQATIRTTPDLVRGTLQVRMGGKNMTFGQKSTAKRLDECIP